MIEQCLANHGRALITTVVDDTVGLLVSVPVRSMLKGLQSFLELDDALRVSFPRATIVKPIVTHAGRKVTGRG